MIDDFDYVLPHELIAQSPLERRDASRLMVVDRQTGEISDRQFRDVVDIMSRDDVLV
ncbi:MAG: S-adenosylmethionine:tRNA ribosyltransferase-isomerase, partial [candidate division WOR-3 bacterium]